MPRQRQPAPPPQPPDTPGAHADPALAALRVAPAGAVLLHSGRPHPRWARRSLLSEPRAWFRYHPDHRSELRGPAGEPIEPTRPLTGNLWSDLRNLLHDNRFPGRWVGYFSYDAARVIEPGKLAPVRSGDWPLVELAWCPEIRELGTRNSERGTEERTEEGTAEAPRRRGGEERGEGGEPSETAAGGAGRLGTLSFRGRGQGEGEVHDTVHPATLRPTLSSDSPSPQPSPSEGEGAGAPPPTFPLSPLPTSPSPSPLRSDLGRTGYEAAVKRVLAYIAAGDVFQVNIAHRITADFVGDPRDLYTRLAGVSPAWYGAYLELGTRNSERGTPERAILSTSPELFLELDAGHVVTRPIKGTRPTRSAFRDPRSELEHAAKDTAELNMIVDLMRNDLGKVCSYGSVRVTHPREIETHPTVYHAVATVEGDLHPTKDMIDLLRATLPGGSVTGAPKVRAMQVIDELEPSPRGPYCGSIGWISRDACQLNIAIRTILLTRNAELGTRNGGTPSDAASALESPPLRSCGGFPSLSLRGRGQGEGEVHDTARPATLPPTLLGDSPSPQPSPSEGEGAGAPRWHAAFHVGAGIVADSDPAAEYEETLAKARAMLAALGVT